MHAPAILRLPLTGKQYRAAALALVLMLASALTEGFGLILLVPMLAVLDGRTSDESALLSILVKAGVPLAVAPLLALFVSLVLMRALINYVRAIQAQRLEMSIVDGLRARAWSALLHADWRTLSEMRQSESASLLITNLDRIGFGVGEALRGLSIAITLVGVGMAAVVISPRIALSAFAIGIAALLAMRGMRRKSALLGDRLTQAYKTVYAQFGEGLGALRIIKSFGSEDRVERASRAAIGEMRAAQMAYIRASSLTQIAIQVGGAMLLAVLVWFALTRWQAGIEQILPLAALFARALPLLGGLQSSWQQWAHAEPAVEESLQLIGRAEAGREAETLAECRAPGLGAELAFENVSVAFHGRSAAALRDVTVSIPAGTITAISGPSGSGKSTLADLAGGLIAPDAGSVMVDGIALEGGIRRAWRERVTYVQQEPVLFSGSVRENLLWAVPDADEGQLDKAVAMAAADFISSLPQGMDTRIGEGGRQLSGGERQRLVLARALLREPSLLILDEASSALDPENEASIAHAVSALRGQMTIIIIGHRGVLSEIAERTVHLEGGRVMDGKS